jgi:small-conductance mechanosensitive channel
MIRTLPARLRLLALLAAPLAAAQVLLPFAAAPPAVAQMPSPFTAAPATTPSKPAAPTNPPSPITAPPSITPEQARQALAVLNDPAKRAEITATLEAIARAQPAAATPAAPTQTPAALGIPLAPDSLGADVLVGAANFMNHAADQLSGTLRAARGVPLLRDWLVTMATDPVARTLLSDLAWRLAIALSVSFIVLWVISRIVRAPLRAVCRRLIRMPPTAPLRQPIQQAGEQPDDQPDGQPDDQMESGEALAELGETEPPRPRRFDAACLMRRVPLVLASVALYLLPVLGFIVAGHVIAGSALGTTSLVRLVLLAVIDSYALCAVILHLAGALLAPHHRRLRLLPVRDATARYAMRWTRRLLVVAVVGYAAAEVGLLLGLSQAAHLALLKATVLVLHICIAIIVIQKRRVVRRWIHAPAGATGIVPAVRDRLAAIWHWIALFYLAALWLVWAVELPAGYQWLSHVVLITLAVAVLAQLARRGGMAALDRLVLTGSELATHYPGLDRRLAFYHPILRTVVRVVVFLLALLLFLQLLDFAVFQWLIASPLGERVAGSLTMLAITVLLALAVWEAANIAIERHLAHLTRQAQIARIARLRTLLPILRTALLVAVLTVTVLMVLSEIGVNTAPLLASAGIIGVAIGFGSQKLVQDLITGLFLLLENTMQVGDVVSLGGLTGVIEALSVRTIHLRAEDGSVHVIPFSSVGTVTNMTRDYGRAVIQVGVAYKENVDRVIEVLCGIVTEMRRVPQFKEVILGDLEVYGLDQLTASAVIIKGRIMCTPFARWSVGREFNRRMKARFEELGIEMPSSDQRLILDQPLTFRQLPPPVPAPQ